jgi:tetratricopeptide (TPR) repeat protein
MTVAPTRHHWITASSRRERERLVASLDVPPVLTRVDAHRRLRGPYTAAGSLVRALVPDALSRCAELVARHDVEVLTVAPELHGRFPCKRDTLTSLSPPEERTRYYPSSRTRRIAHGLVELLRDLVRATHDEPRTIVFEQVDSADPTDLEWIAILLRRVDPATLRLVVCTRGDAPDRVLGEPLDRYAVRITGSDQPDHCPVAGDTRELAASYIASDCISDDRALRAAYDALSPLDRAAMHDRRAGELEQRDELSLGLGSVPFHRERGADPEGAGAEALLAALQHCMLMGFYDGVIDLARRCYAVLDWETQPERCWLVTAKITMALAVQGRPDEAATLYDEGCAQSTLPNVHLRAAYGRAMLYTRHYDREHRDAGKAKTWINTAIALASQSPDPKQRAFNVTFTQNALALIEMRLGDPRKALELVTGCLKHLDEEIEDHRQLLHRSVLRYNRAQLLDRFGTPEEALAEYSRVIAEDPHQSEYYVHRAAVYRRLGKAAEALRDYDRAIRVSPPYPEPHYARAQLALELGDVNAALQDLSYVLELDPSFIDARVDRSSVLFERGDLEGALRDADAGLAIDPAHAELHALRASVVQQQGRLEDAHEAFATALRCDPTLAAAWSNRAALWYEQGEIERAIEDLTRALELEDDPDIRANRALAYEAAGRRREAAADREHAEAAATLG